MPDDQTNLPFTIARIVGDATTILAYSADLQVVQDGLRMVLMTSPDGDGIDLSRVVRIEFLDANLRTVPTDNAEHQGDDHA